MDTEDEDFDSFNYQSVLLLQGLEKNHSQAAARLSVSFEELFQVHNY